VNGPSRELLEMELAEYAVVITRLRMRCQCERQSVLDDISEAAGATRVFSTPSEGLLYAFCLRGRTR